MRRLVIASAALLLGLLVVQVPTVSAAPTCPEKTIGSPYSLGVEANSDCTVVVTNKPYDCFWGGHWTVYNVGPLTVRSYSCSPPGEGS